MFVHYSSSGRNTEVIIEDDDNIHGNLTMFTLRGSKSEQLDINEKLIWQIIGRTRSQIRDM